VYNAIEVIHSVAKFIPVTEHFRLVCPKVHNLWSAEVSKSQQ